MKISASIVMYKTNPETLSKAIESFLGFSEDTNRTLYLVDNSPTNQLSKFESLDPRIIYIFNPSNPGFGAAHNIAINIANKEGNKYHFVINPDVSTKSDVVNVMVNFMEEQDEVGMCMPKILNSDDTPQFLPKLLPSPFSIIMRKLKFPKKLYRNFIEKYELRVVPTGMIYEAPVLSGCFTAFRVAALETIGTYDDTFFMYFEDWDLSRRMTKKYKTIYYPEVSIYHDYESGANHNHKLFMIFIQSAIYYFNKWGWFIDKERKEINRLTLSQFK
ncbi:TPA: glycosyltransferase [Streptococcus suis]